MLSLDEARSLLHSARDLDSLTDIAAALGFPRRAPALDEDLHRQLGLPAGVAEARISQGRGGLRCLLMTLPDSAPPREVLHETANALARKSPHLLWVLIATGASGQVAICVFEQRDRNARIHALIAATNRVIESDAAALASLSSASGAADVLTHSRWAELLGREAITARFFRSLQSVIANMSRSLTPSPGAADARELALLTVSRLLFLSFVESKGWLDADFDFLSNRFADSIAHGGRFHRNVLNALFFGTLNTPVRRRAPRARAFGRIPFLNGGMFSRTPLERKLGPMTFDDDLLGAVFSDLLTRYRFTPREESRTWTETAIDPEILGKAFESLMAVRDRKVGGVFYTPQRIVEDVTRSSLARALAGGDILPRDAESVLAGEHLPPGKAAAMLERIGSIRVLDPACGSGAFLVHTLERLASLRALCGDARPASQRRREVLSTSIFGVDSNPTAVWLCELRLWLSVVLESGETDPMRLTPLPNLDRHIRVGDSLSGGDLSDTPKLVRCATYSRLRSRYMRATGARKRQLGQALDRAELEEARNAARSRITMLQARRHDILACARSRDLFGERAVISAELTAAAADARREIRTLRERMRGLASGAALPFAFQTHFPDAIAAGGFDLVIGNPPWVRLHHIPRSSRGHLKRDFASSRNAAWSLGAVLARAGSGFAGQVDLGALFMERAVRLARPGGVVGFLLPAKFWRSLSSGGLRSFLQSESSVEILEDYSTARSAFDAAVYPSMIVARRRDPAATTTGNEVLGAVHRRDSFLRWAMPRDTMAFDSSPGSPWLLVPPEVRWAFDRVMRAGEPLGEGSRGRPLLGVKSGCNDAFVVRVVNRSGDVAEVEAGGRRGTIESAYLRPLVRGEDITPWIVRGATDMALVWPYDENGIVLKSLPPHLASWLAPWRRRLDGRADARSCHAWWRLYRTESADPSRPRVVWSDFGKSLRAAVIGRGDEAVAINSCYVLKCAGLKDAHALAAILNSPLTTAWLKLLAEPARGGYLRFLGWTMSLLPIPADWARTVSLMSALGSADTRGTDRDLFTAHLSAMRLRESDVEPLMMWALE